MISPARSCVLMRVWLTDADTEEVWRVGVHPETCCQCVLTAVPRETVCGRHSFPPFSSVHQKRHNCKRRRRDAKVELRWTLICSSDLFEVALFLFSSVYFVWYSWEGLRPFLRPCCSFVVEQKVTSNTVRWGGQDIMNSIIRLALTVCLPCFNWVRISACSQNAVGSAPCN